jgi:hypothetical protein
LGWHDNRKQQGVVWEEEAMSQAVSKGNMVEKERAETV